MIYYIAFFDNHANIKTTSVSKTEKNSFIYTIDDASIAVCFTGYKQTTLYENFSECLVCF